MRARAIEPIVLVSAVARIWLAFVVSHSAYCQPVPAAAEVLQKVKATYTNMNQYRWSATITEKQVSASGKNNVTTASVLVAVQKPNQVRWEVSGSGAATYTGMYVGDEIIVSGRDQRGLVFAKTEAIHHNADGPTGDANGNRVIVHRAHMKTRFSTGSKSWETLRRGC
jgi:hypothetical protein